VKECDHQPVAALEGLTTRRESREILRRSRRIASAINGHSQEEEVVQAIYLLLAQEGVLVGELAEEIVARAFQDRPLPARDGLSAFAKGAPAPSAGTCTEQPNFSLSSP
jgi:hypothetical protein